MRCRGEECLAARAPASYTPGANRLGCLSVLPLGELRPHRSGRGAVELTRRTQTHELGDEEPAQGGAFLVWADSSRASTLRDRSTACYSKPAIAVGKHELLGDKSQHPPSLIETFGQFADDRDALCNRPRQQLERSAIPAPPKLFEQPDRSPITEIRDTKLSRYIPRSRSSTSASAK